MKVLDFDKHSLEIKFNWGPDDYYTLKEHFSFRAHLDYKNSEVTLIGLDINEHETYFCKMYTKFYRKDLMVQPVCSFMVWLENIHKYLNRHNLYGYKILCKVDIVPGLFPELDKTYKFDLDKYTFELLEYNDYLYGLYPKKRIRCPDFKPLIVPDAMGFKKLFHTIQHRI